MLLSKKILVSIIGVIVGIQGILVSALSYKSYKELKDYENILSSEKSVYVSYAESINQIKRVSNNKEEHVENNTIESSTIENKGIEYNNEEVLNVGKESTDKRKNILLVGVDSRSRDFSGRSDTILLLSLSSSGSYLISIPRDSYVYLKDKGRYDKINHSYAYGGVDSLEDAVGRLLDIKIDNYAVINFYNFVDLINSVGGIEVEVPFSFKEKGLKGETISFTKGKMVLDGDEALAYVRMRKSDSRGDVGRNERQKQVIHSFMDKVISIEGIKNGVSIYNTYKKMVKTDLSVWDIPKYIGYVAEISNIKSITLYGRGEKIKGVYYMILDKKILQDTKEILKK